MTPYIAYSYGRVWSYICWANDIDWFKFYVYAGDQMQVDLGSLPANYGMALVGVDGDLIAISDNPGADPEQIVALATMTG